MDNEKNLNFEASAQKEGDFQSESSSRARNRTVMLTPEITGQVRARIAQEMDQGFTGPGKQAEPQSATGTFVPGPNVGRASAADSGEFRPVTGAQKPAIAWSKETPVVGFLVSFDSNPNGEVYELRSGRLMVTSQPAGGSNCLLIKDDSVSPMHAIMRVSSTGEIQVLDQLSEFGTKIQRFGSTEEQALSGDKGTVEHGDVIKFGNRRFHVCVIAKGESA
ncbi:MAG: FHA domain-containing protein [Oligoflexia bacterium]|nr:FHA domain-containing protein [Oligoflexia bacterium]